MKKLEEKDREKILEYVGQEPEMNLFFIGDIENHGIDTEEVSIFALEDAEGWDCVLLKYFDFYIIYSQKKQYRASQVADFLKGRTVDCISGKTELVRQLQPYYPELKLQETYMCRCGREELLTDRIINPGSSAQENVILRKLELEDIPQIMKLNMLIEEFAPTYSDPEKSEQQLKTDLPVNLSVGVFEGDELAAIARTSASNSISAMIVDVATAPEKRGKGYASMAVRELCRSSFAGGRKFLCLFYDNPAAGRIYHRIGFRETGSYAMMR